jgi:hypothetical protein
MMSLSTQFAGQLAVLSEAETARASLGYLTGTVPLAVIGIRVHGRMKVKLNLALCWRRVVSFIIL